MAVEQLVIALVSLAFAPGVLLLFLTIILASLGRSVGLRKLYVDTLLKIFEYGAGKQTGQGSVDGESEDEAEEAPPQEPNIYLKNGENGVKVIEREVSLGSDGMRVRLYSQRSMEDIEEFQLSDSMYFVKSGIEAIIDDDVTKCFAAEELSSWNLLTRTNARYPELNNFRLTLLWGTGFVLRYFFLLPFRATIAVIGICWLIICTAFIGYIRQSAFKKFLNQYVSLMCYRILARAFSAVIKFHNIENRAQGGGICVANHTSPIDVVILSVDNCYAMVGQSHGGFLGIMQRAMARATDHVWFERSEMHDRAHVGNRLKEHVADKNKLPILIFPEGTCINNTSVMMFKKGSFEVGGVIYPAAIKYDPRFGDVFWNSSMFSMVQHIFMLLTSWAIVCDVWYLAPEQKREDETSVQFANRIKALIAEKGGLVDLDWDGALKRSKPKPTMIQNVQRDYSTKLAKKTE